MTRMPRKDWQCKECKENPQEEVVAGKSDLHIGCVHRFENSLSRNKGMLERFNMKLSIFKAFGRLSKLIQGDT